MVITEKYGYEKHNTDIVSDKDIKRVCAYFVVSDLHKIGAYRRNRSARELGA